MSDELEHGPGWQVDPTTLRPRIIDAAAFAEARANDPLREVLTPLWGDDAVGAEALLRGAGDDFRTRVLLADALSAQGRHDEALAALDSLTTEATDPGRQAMLAHRVGRARLAAGELDGAAEAFARAVVMRTAMAGDRAALATSRHGLQLARSRAGR